MFVPPVMLAEAVPELVVPNTRVRGSVIVPVRVPPDMTIVKGAVAFDPDTLARETAELKAPVVSGTPGLNCADPARVMVVAFRLIGPVRIARLIVVLVVAAFAATTANTLIARNTEVRFM